MGENTNGNQQPATSNQQPATSNQHCKKSWLFVKELVAIFDKKKSHYLSAEYQEAQVRKDFIDKLFIGMGWDVNHNDQLDPYRQEVRIETAEKRAKGRADYAFSISPHFKKVRFFVEAKRPQANIATANNCFQAIRYSWPKSLPIAVLTDFHSIHIIDSRFQPKISSAESCIVMTLHYSELNDFDKFSKLYWLLSREAVELGSIDNFAENNLPAAQMATRQYSLIANEAREFDDVFLQQLDQWRQSLAVAFINANNNLTNYQLTECVQRALDRLIFIRFLEDKGIEPDEIIARFGKNNKKPWQDYIAKCKNLDAIYNGIVFKPHSIIDSRDFNPDSSIFLSICDELTDEHTPYNFDSIPVEILGRIYERFLGKVVERNKNKVSVVDKEDVRKAGGVFYTPDYIVAYMVDNALGDRVKNKTADAIIKIRAIDTSCGSGSFLIGVFGYLLDAATAYFIKYPKQAKKGEIEERNGEVYLSLSYKRRILKECIFGVDIDPQAVEVAQLSLYLKLMEDETTDTKHKQQQIEIGVTLLPTLTSNVIVGNSLITACNDLFTIEKMTSLKALDFKMAFPDAFRDGGFDLLIGNPPYIKEYTNSSAFEHIKNSPYYMGKMDIWYMFACVGIDLLKEDGKLAYIATNNWTTNSGAKLLRQKVTSDAKIEQLIDFGSCKIFRDADIQTMIMLAKKSNKNQKYSFDFRRLTGAKHTTQDAISLLEKEEGLFRSYISAKFDRNRNPVTPFTFSSAGYEDLLDRIDGKRNFTLNPKDEVAQGIVAPQDFINKKTSDILEGKFKIGDGIFVLSDLEKKSLHLSKEEAKLLKPYFTSNELNRYSGVNANKYWIVYTDSSFKNEKRIDSYPIIKKHLDKFRAVITSDNAPYGLHRSRNEKFFTGNKIMALRKCGSPCFTYTDFPCYVSQTYNVIKSERINMIYLTALLNSRVVMFWLKQKGKMQGLNYQLDKEPILNIPLIIPTEEIQIEIEAEVKKIIECRSKFKSGNTESDGDVLDRFIKQSENKIQSIVYDLYDLDKDDIDLIHRDTPDFDK